MGLSFTYNFILNIILESVCLFKKTSAVLYNWSHMMCFSSSCKQNVLWFEHDVFQMPILINVHPYRIHNKENSKCM